MPTLPAGWITNGAVPSVIFAIENAVFSVPIIPVINSHDCGLERFVIRTPFPVPTPVYKTWSKAKGAVVPMPTLPLEFQMPEPGKFAVVATDR